MKKKDIKVGEEYAVGRQSSHSSRYRVRIVAETRKRQVSTSTWSSHKKDTHGWVVEPARRDDITSRYGGLVTPFMPDDQGRPCVASAEVVMPWAQWEERKAAQKEAEERAQRERNERQAREARVRDAFEGYGISVSHGPGFAPIAFNLDEAQKVLGLMSIPAEPGPIEVGP